MSRRLLRIVSHPLSPFNMRAFYALLAFATVMIVGTLGLMDLESWSPVNSFYFLALIATAEGPAATPATDAGKIFASVMWESLARSARDIIFWRMAYPSSLARAVSSVSSSFAL